MAEYRKIIKFGKHSLIISLPKSWTRQNNLKQGDSVLMDVLSHNLIVSPGASEYESSEEKVVLISLDTEEDLMLVQFRIVDSYINNANKIVITGRLLGNDASYIREIMHRMIALEIIEATPDRLVAKCYLNMNDISVSSLLKKIDNIIRSMFLDVLAQIREPDKFGDFDLVQNITQRDQDINRLSYLILRTIKYSFENPYAIKSSKSKVSFLSVWDTTKTLELIGDEIKAIANLLETITSGNIRYEANRINSLSGLYSKMITAYFKGNKDQAIKLSQKSPRCADLKSVSSFMELDAHIGKLCDLIISISYLFD